MSKDLRLASKKPKLANVKLRRYAKESRRSPAQTMNMNEERVGGNHASPPQTYPQKSQSQGAAALMKNSYYQRASNTNVKYSHLLFFYFVDICSLLCKLKVEETKTRYSESSM
jgi:hypothetical protein